MEGTATCVPKVQYFFPSVCLCLRRSRKSWCTRSLMTPWSSLCCRYGVLLGHDGDRLSEPQQKNSFAEHTRNMVSPSQFLSLCVCLLGEAAWGWSNVPRVQGTTYAVKEEGEEVWGGMCVEELGVGEELGGCALEDCYLRNKGSLGKR